MNLTPAMRQYLEVKQKYPDCIIFFRIGDFYEMFFEDAITASRILEITLTSRNKGKEDSVPLCGVPFHSAAPYISRLVENGFKVAVCEQVEDPREAKGVVKREVVRIATPGLLTEPENLKPKENHFLAAICVHDGHYGLAFLDISTGEFRVSDSQDRELFVQELSSFDFREIIMPEELKGQNFTKAISARLDPARFNYLPSGYFDSAKKSTIDGVFSPELLERLDDPHCPASSSAAIAALLYARETQMTDLRHINRIERLRGDEFMVLDANARRSLEIFETMQDGTRQGSLFHVLDETVTPMGGRRLRWWLNYPLLDADKINSRLSAVAEIKGRHLLRRELREELKKVYDLERLGSRISMASANARDLLALKDSLEALPAIKELVKGLETATASSIYKKIDEMPETVVLIGRSIADNPPPTLRESGIIREGYDSGLDNLITLGRDGKKWIARLEQTERQKTGIQSLKVGFNSVFGYYIEITKANANLVPQSYIRKQTLVNAERYITQELKEYEDALLSADTRRKEMEYELFIEVRSRIAKDIKSIQQTAAALSELDALSSLAEVAEANNYCCPAMDGSGVIEISDGRHPVVEKTKLAEGFVPNDLLLDSGSNRLLILTGPNMAGKSTYIRQVALIALMAQIGSFVPASAARIGVVDRIFTRVGAADNLARGQSTFHGGNERNGGYTKERHIQKPCAPR